MKCNPLVCFANVYDCQPSIDSFNDLPCDKLRLDYFEYPNQFLEAQKFFLEHKEYTHFVYLAPDLVISKSQFNELKKLCEAWDYDVYGPVANVDLGKYKNKLNCCIKLPTIKWEFRNYRWIQEEARQYFMNAGIMHHNVKFNGLTFCFIKRHILEKYKFSTLPVETDEKPLWETRGGWACDLAFCHYCNYANIDIIVNLKIKLKHLRFIGANQVGKKEPKITFLKYDGNQKHGIKNSSEGEIQSSS